MPRTRKNVWSLNHPWDDVLVWYAKAVGEMQKRPIKNLASWNSLGAIHGFDQQLWIAFGYISSTTQLPSAADQNKYWAQCQHQSWYFLPWHRGYLAAFEAIVLDTIVKMGGPKDWALPYWNYSDTHDSNALTFPPAFASTTMPDGSNNPLFVKRRYGDGTGHVVIEASDVLLDALTETQFPGGSGSGGSTGFGGPVTTFQHDGTDNGLLERQPHNGIHGLVGGRIPGTNPQDARNYGLMSMPDTAGLDPIFWLHHANIDRLWEVWLARDPANQNPGDSDWQTGPADRIFSMPRPDGTGYDYAAKDVLDTTKLDYVYDDTSDPFAGTTRVATRMKTLAVEATVASAVQETPVASQKPAELIGANDKSVRLMGATVQTTVALDEGVKKKMIESFAANSIKTMAKEPDRVFLNLENIRGINDAAVFYVYVNLPAGATPSDNPDHLAGVVSLFGVRKASRTDSPHGGNGINESLEITKVVDKLHLNNPADLDKLNVSFVSRTPIGPEDEISVGRVSVYRQGQ